MNGNNGEPISVTYKGYLGTAYDVSSYVIKDPAGREIFHTGFTTNPVDDEKKALEYLKDTLNMLEMFEERPIQYDEEEEDDFTKGMREAWNLARLLRKPLYPGSLRDDLKEKIFGFREADQIFTHVDPVEALERFNKFKAEKASINPGDEVIYTDPTEGHTKRYVITCVENDRYGWIDEEGHTGCFDGRMFHKTGRFFPEIKKLKEAMSCAK